MTSTIVFECPVCQKRFDQLVDEKVPLHLSYLPLGNCEGSGSEPIVLGVKEEDELASLTERCLGIINEISKVKDTHKHKYEALEVIGQTVEYLLEHEQNWADDMEDEDEENLEPEDDDDDFWDDDEFWEDDELAF